MAVQLTVLLYAGCTVHDEIFERVNFQYENKMEKILSLPNPYSNKEGILNTL